MEENGKRQLAIALVALSGVIYFFVCAIPLSRELILEPAWAVSIPTGAATLGLDRPTAGHGSRLSFRLKGSFGYFDEAGASIFAAPVSFGCAISDEAYVSYDRLPEYLSLRNAQGQETARISEPGYPFWGGGRLFVMHPGQVSVAEIGSDGKRLWTHDFPSVITAFDACPSMALFGLLDGSLVGLDSKGDEVLGFSPGGSRIPGIYGCAISPDGLLAAAISGLDSQRLVVLEKRSSAYRVTYHRYLDSNFRRAVDMSFTEDGRFLLYEQEGRFFVYDPSKRREAVVDSAFLGDLGLFSSAREILVAIESGEGGRDILCASPVGKRLFTLPFNAEDSSIALSSDAIFLGLTSQGGASNMLRLDFKEE